MQFIRLSDLIAANQLQGKRVFIRADLNVPQDDSGNITEDTRIRASVPAIQQSLKAGAAVMVTSHLGRPTEGEFKSADSLAPVAKRLTELLGVPVLLKQNWLDGVDVLPGQVVLLENCRVNKGEKKNDDALAKIIVSNMSRFARKKAVAARPAIKRGLSKLICICPLFIKRSGTMMAASAQAGAYRRASCTRFGKVMRCPTNQNELRAIKVATNNEIMVSQISVSLMLASNAMFRLPSLLPFFKHHGCSHSNDNREQQTQFIGKIEAKHRHH